MKEIVQFIDVRFLVEILILVVGIILGNRFAIFRDKRKEFNDVADEVHFALKKQKETIENGRAVKRGPEDKDLEDLKRRIPFYKRRKLEASLQKYFEATSKENWNQDGYGNAFYNDTNKVIESIDSLIQFTGRK